MTSVAINLGDARRTATHLLRKHPRELIVLGLLGAAGAAALASAAWSNTPPLTSRAAAAASSTLPAPPPLLVRAVPPETALSINQTIPVDNGPNPAARAFSTAKASPASFAQALQCLTSAVYYEAGQESTAGQMAVAQVVLNRVRHPAFPASVCGVVYQGSTRVTGCQFTFTCDGSLARAPMAASWARARTVAEAALKGAVYAPVGLATHYHANYVVPYWASSLAKNAVVGTHIFYRWTGGWGRPPAFTKRYAAVEPNSAALRIAALAAEAAQPAAAPAEVAEAIAEIPGAEVKAPEKGRVAVRFSLAAREAVEKAPREAYVEKFKASDNLKWTLGAGAPSSAPAEKPLGKAQSAPASPGPGSSGAASTASVAAAPRL